MPDAINPDVRSFFETYRAAWEQLEPLFIASLFAYPCHIASDAEEVTLFSVPTQEVLSDQLTHMLRLYRQLGASSAQILSLQTTELSSRLTQAVVHWQLHDAAGHPLYDFRAMYTLATMAGQRRIVAIAHNEIPQYREGLARIQSQRTLHTGEDSSD